MAPTSKLTAPPPKPSDKDKANAAEKAKSAESKKKIANALEEDDEFEDFPADAYDDGPDESLEHQWEDTWEDDQEEVDFAAQLKEQESRRTGVAPMAIQ
ncbi:hypothetical protein HK097_004921 [Rhizophlyctis rosea]|uniref:26S proteasome complex subunit SEM1 n=1 Tax=Rhizophlyctis rosea TaxID=64517 RepID=A0AAD5S1Y6_9FUNG|nr:hypothetical protein HK097_004921 [Rhizophlyctis rosea]